MLQRAFTDLKSLGGFTANHLCIYRWAEFCSEIDHTHPLFPLVWQSFFMLYLQRPQLDESSWVVCIISMLFPCSEPLCLLVCNVQLKVENIGASNHKTWFMKLGVVEVLQHRIVLDIAVHGHYEFWIFTNPCVKCVSINIILTSLAYFNLVVYLDWQQTQYGWYVNVRWWMWYWSVLLVPTVEEDPEAYLQKLVNLSKCGRGTTYIHIIMTRKVRAIFKYLSYFISYYT